jgi:hypothetical protein
MNRLKTHARALGCSELIGLDVEANPSHLEYLDLLPGKFGASLLPDAVAEFQRRALLYLVDGFDEAGESRLDPPRIQDLQTLLANRSEHACLGVVKTGSLEVYPINLDRKALARANFKTISISDPCAPTFFQSLVTGTFDVPGRPKQADYVYETIHRLLTEASEDLAGTKDNAGPMDGLDVLSTTGRALFFRFLIDRRIVLPAELTEICPGADSLKDTFSTAEKAAATSCWLDETFNGDLLPLAEGLTSEASPAERLRAYRRFYRAAGDATGQRLFGHLQAILKGWKHVGDSQFQLSFEVDWDDFNFAYIPIGVLSQVYETFSRQWDEAHAEETGVYYTPRHLAKFLVEEAFAGLKNPADAIVLDPACGAGVFLALALRQLVHEQWKKHGSRPETRAIQRILYKQLRGFEVSESALRLSALTLYISAIEMNGTQRPPRSLKFPRPLRNEVLFNFGEHEKVKRRGFVLGSLGPHVPAAFNNSFDIVVTNPPWTRLRPSAKDSREKAEQKKRIDEMNGAFTALTRRVLTARRLKVPRTYKNPDNNPDLPFLWRSTEWAKPGGVIAMALPGRVILKQGGSGKVARDAIMRGLAVTGILNGSDLEKTAVWPSMDLPFLLLFARNALPDTDHRFHFATPIRESFLSNRGQFRLDYQAAEPVEPGAVIAKPWLLKALATGTVLDVDVIEKTERKWASVLGDFWRPPLLQSGVGYKLAPNLDQKPANGLFDLEEFEPPTTGFQVDFSVLQKWRCRHDEERVHSPGKDDVYTPPLLIVPQTPGEERDQPKSFLSRHAPLCFSQSYYGYSSHGHDDAQLLVCTLYLITHSLLFQHWCLVRSSRIGASYRTFIKEDLDSFPFPNLSRLTAEQQHRIVELADLLETSTIKPWDEIDDFLFSLYGLDEDDATVVRDTVTFCGPYRSVRERGEHPLSPDELKAFCQYLEDMLQPLFQITGQRVVVKTVPQAAGWGFPSWHFVSIAPPNDELRGNKKLLSRLIEEANKTGASRIVLRVPDGGLLLGILNQRRFWTHSRARLCSLYIEQNHLDAFPILTR